MYVPELIFGHLLTSSNYDDKEKKVRPWEPRPCSAHLRACARCGHPTVLATHPVPRSRTAGHRRPERLRRQAGKHLLQRVCRGNLRRHPQTPLQAGAPGRAPGCARGGLESAVMLVRGKGLAWSGESRPDTGVHRRGAQLKEGMAARAGSGDAGAGIDRLAPYPCHRCSATTWLTRGSRSSRHAVPARTGPASPSNPTWPGELQGGEGGGI